MKRKIFLISLLIICLILLNTVVFAVISNNDSNKNSILTGEKLSKVEDAYIEISQPKMLKSVSTTQNDSIDEANFYLTSLNISKEQMLTSDSTIKYYNNALEHKIEKVIANENTILKLDAENGELLSYINKKNDFEKCFDNEETVKLKAVTTFNSLNIDDKSNYELYYVEQFDDEIWRASFVKKYGEKINAGESINFSFSPVSEEILTLSINKKKYENNEIVITENEARKVAQKYLNKSVATEMKLSLEIVMPNYFLKNLEGDDTLYTEIQTSRNAYVATFNNAAKSQIYIDATTGEIIGGNMMLGGKF